MRRGSCQWPALRADLLRVSHAPRHRPFVPARSLEELYLRPGHVAPGALAPRPLAGSACQEGHPIASWPLRFHSPEAMPCPFASPRNKEGSHTPSPRSGACSTGERRDKPSRVLKRSKPRRPTPRHPEFGRLRTSLRQGMRILSQLSRWGKTSAKILRRSPPAPWRGVESFFRGVPGIGGVGAVFLR